MRIAVIGAGGVGGYFGARLAAAGQDVVFVARGRHLAAVRERGLTVRSPLGDVSVPPGAFVASPAEVEAADAVLVAVKLWDTEEAARHLRPLAEAGAAVVSLQNGVRKDEVLGAHVPAGAVLGGVSYISAAITEPGVVTRKGELQKLVFGEYGAGSAAGSGAGARSGAGAGSGPRSGAGAGSGGRAARLRDAFAAAGVEAEESADIERVVWEKFVFLVGLSGTTSAVRQPIGVVRSTPGSRALLAGLMREATAVGRARGVALDPELAEERLAFCDTLPAAMSSSMHHDLTHGNRLELPWLSGEVSRLGRELGVPTPRNDAVAEILAPYVMGAPRTP